ncbi:MAG TPA: polysaccharide deacetylase family protein [Solirubrobacterales bacterium]
MRKRILLSLLRSVRKRRPVILLYHGIGTPRPEHDPHNLQVAPEAFRAQLELLREAGFGFTRVRELVRALPAPGLAAVTFDDGMLDNLTTAAPILAELGAPATVYVQTGAIGQPNPWMDPAAGERMMTAEELRELAALGWEIGGHTVTHPDLSKLDRDECVAEMARGKEELETIIGAGVVSFALGAPLAGGGEVVVECVEVRREDERGARPRDPREAREHAAFAAVRVDQVGVEGAQRAYHRDERPGVGGGAHRADHRNRDHPRRGELGAIGLEGAEHRDLVAALGEVGGERGDVRESAASVGPKDQRDPGQPLSGRCPPGRPTG